MYQIDFNKPEYVHFIGTGGISISGLAEILSDERFSISGSGSHEMTLTERLEKEGARVYYGQRMVNIEKGPGVNVVMCTAAIHGDNPEFRTARDQGLPMLSRTEFLGELMRNYKETIIISGTYDKTTTTSMLTDILLAGDLDSIIPMGGILKDVGGNIHTGGPSLFVIEACEYTNSFLSFYPTIEVILDVEEDHLNFFEDIEGIHRSFHLFTDKLPIKGPLAINGGAEKVEEITKGLNCGVVTFGRDPSSTHMARNITHDGFARPSYGLIIQEEATSRITLDATEEHNVHNSLATIAVALELGVGFNATVSGLGEFAGTDRWSEKKGEVVDITVIDDYVHHPQGIRATLAAARNYPHGRLWCVLQPYIYTRTRAFLGQFAKVLSAVDEVILADIYTARETDILGVSSRGVADRVEKLDTRAHYIPFFDGIETFILENCMNDDLLVTVGAGGIVGVGERLLG